MLKNVAPTMYGETSEQIIMHLDVLMIT